MEYKTFLNAIILLQVAERQGKYLVGLLNNIGKQNGGKALSAKEISLGDPFVYKHLGSMASVGRYKALVDLRQSKVHHILCHLYYSSIKPKVYLLVGYEHSQRNLHGFYGFN